MLDDVPLQLTGRGVVCVGSSKGKVEDYRLSITYRSQVLGKNYIEMGVL